MSNIRYQNTGGCTDCKLKAQKIVKNLKQKKHELAVARVKQGDFSLKDDLLPEVGDILECKRRDIRGIHYQGKFTGVSYYFQGYVPPNKPTSTCHKIISDDVEKVKVRPDDFIHIDDILGTEDTVGILYHKTNRNSHFRVIKSEDNIEKLKFSLGLNTKPELERVGSSSVTSSTKTPSPANNDSEPAPEVSSTDKETKISEDIVSLVDQITSLSISELQKYDKLILLNLKDELLKKENDKPSPRKGFLTYVNNIS